MPIENAQTKGQKKKKGPVGVRTWAQPPPQNGPAVVHVGSVVPIRPNIITQTTARMSTGGGPRRAQPQQPQNDPAVIYVGPVPFPIRPMSNTQNTIPIRPMSNTQITTAQPRRAIQPRNGRPILAYSQTTTVQPQNNPSGSNIQTRSQPQNGPSGSNIQTRAQPQNGPSGSNVQTRGQPQNATRPSDAFV